MLGRTGILLAITGTICYAGYECSRSVFIRDESHPFPFRRFRSGSILLDAVDSRRTNPAQPTLCLQSYQFFNSESESSFSYFPKSGIFQDIPPGFYKARSNVGPFNSLQISRAYICSQASYKADPIDFLKKHSDFQQVDVARSSKGEFLFLVADTGDEIFISFRGSSSWADWVKNFSILPNFTEPQLHPGFASCVPNIPVSRWRDELNSAKPIFFCGHSKGAAVAHCAMLKTALSTSSFVDSNSYSIGFAVPLWCDKRLINTIQKWAPGGGHFLSIINSEDVVPYLLQPQFLGTLPAPLLAYLSSDNLGKTIAHLIGSVSKVVDPLYAPFGTTILLNETLGRLQLFENLTPENYLVAYPRTLPEVTNLNNASAAIEAHGLNNYGLILSSMMPRLNPPLSFNSQFSPNIKRATLVQERNDSFLLYLYGTNLDFNMAFSEPLPDYINIPGFQTRSIVIKSPDNLVISLVPATSIPPIDQPIPVTLRTYFGESSTLAERLIPSSDPLNPIFPALLFADDPKIAFHLRNIGIDPSKLRSSTQVSPSFLGILRQLDDGITSCIPPEGAFHLDPQKKEVFLASLLLAAIPIVLAGALDFTAHGGGIISTSLYSIATLFGFVGSTKLFAKEQPFYADTKILLTFWEAAYKFCLHFNILAAAQPNPSITELCLLIKRFRDIKLPSEHTQPARIESLQKLVKDLTNKPLVDPSAMVKFIDAAASFYDLANQVKDFRLLIVIGPKNAGKSTLVQDGFHIPIHEYNDTITNLGTDVNDTWYWANTPDKVTIVNTPGINQVNSWIDPADLTTGVKYAPSIPLLSKTLYAVVIDQSQISTDAVKAFLERSKDLFVRDRAVLIINKFDSAGKRLTDKDLEAQRATAMSYGIPSESVIFSSFSSPLDLENASTFPWATQIFDVDRVANLLRERLQRL